MATTRPTDSLGVEFRVGDTVTVSAWGAPVRLIDTGRRAEVAGFTRSGNIRLRELTPAAAADPIARGLAVRPGCLLVARRDGAPGHEGNRPHPLTAHCNHGSTTGITRAHLGGPTRRGFTADCGCVTIFSADEIA